MLNGSRPRLLEVEPGSAHIIYYVKLTRGDGKNRKKTVDVVVERLYAACTN